ncbi:MAG: hypothetical protein ACRBN8_22800 [Nannocystales bacterium]
MNRALCTCLFVFGMLLGRPAAAASIEEYRAEIDLRDPDVTRYSLRLDYTKDSPYEVKEHGFKFVGEEPIRNLRLIDSAKATIGQAHGFVEQRIEFTLPADSEGEPQPIEFSFERDPLVGRRRWTSVDYEVLWLSRFGVNVGSTSIVLLAPPDWSVDGFSCTPLGDHQRCERITGTPIVVAFSASRPSDFAWNIFGALVSALLLLAGFVLGGRQARKRWIAALGVLPVLHEPPEPVLSQSYRAPAPLPVETELEPVLSEEDGKLMTTRLRQSFGVAAAGLIGLGVVVPGHVESSPALWFVAYGLVASIFAAVTANRLEGWRWVPILVAAAALLHPSLVALGLEPDGDLLLFSPLLLFIPIFGAKSRGGSSSSRSSGSDSAFFSCGGGGCGGGGCGGGGCGGCGG